jgi:hypothetical protein
LLDETLIVMCGEMGRTQRISPIAVGGKNASGEAATATLVPRCQASRGVRMLPMPKPATEATAPARTAARTTSAPSPSPTGFIPAPPS